MPGRRRLGRALVTVGVIAGFAVAVAPADASFHWMKVREVQPRTAPGADDSYVELQMWVLGQNLVSGRTVTIYNAAGNVIRAYTMDASVDNGATQATILIGDTGAPGSPDFTDNQFHVPAGGGAVCFNDAEPADCVAWGDFAGSFSPSGGTSAVGSPVAPGGVTGGQALRRDISGGCPTFFEQSDDTDDSATDFDLVTPGPRNNAAPILEQACPNTVINSQPNNPVASQGATFSFSSSGGPPGSPTFQCKLDTEASFSACTSPKSYPSVAEGTRTFSVKATVAGSEDPTPATYTWRVDLTAPDTQVSEPKPADPNASANAILGFQALGALAIGETAPTFQCRLITPSVPNPSFGACTTPQDRATVISGTYAFEVKAVDQAGNVDQSPATHTWVVDRTPPDTTITGQPDNPSTSTTADFDYESTEAGSTFKCRIDNAASFTACPADGVYNGLIDGSHTFRVRAIDPLGNEDPTEDTYTWTVDATADPPPDTAITKAPKKKGTDKTPKVSFTATPPTGATFQCRVDADPFEPCASPHTTAKLKTGKHTFEVAASGPGGADPTPAKASFKIIRR